MLFDFFSFVIPNLKRKKKEPVVVVDCLGSM
jgi:hypothetical protein